MADSLRKLLGEDAEAESSDLILRIHLSAIKRLEQALRQLPLAEEEREKALGAAYGLRLVPARAAFARTAKMLPGLAARLGKELDFVFEGEETPVDCEAIRDLNAALLHMVRNSLDHGLETPEEREAAGKDPKGRLTLSVAQVGETLSLKLSDDGRGIDPEFIRAAAVAKGVISPAEAATLSKDDCVNLIFRPGFSTAKNVSEVSGRGVGMDAVLAAVREGLGGSLSVHSEPGRGSSVFIKIPASLRHLNCDAAGASISGRKDEEIKPCPSSSKTTTQRSASPETPMTLP
jgi:two-component system chemotaxis sensor kinase CheA